MTHKNLTRKMLLLGSFSSLLFLGGCTCLFSTDEYGCWPPELAFAADDTLGGDGDGDGGGDGDG
ncbi:MAG: hypothetical protein OEM59_13355, partial [Rhodospirillales bacterium]|nr:hypothetical protein [Rhodospirillales bacterium]